MTLGMAFQVPKPTPFPVRSFSLYLMVVVSRRKVLVTVPVPCLLACCHDDHRL